MSVKRLLAIGAIYGLACGGWILLGTATHVRSSTYFERLSARVEGLWGMPVEQPAPRFSLAMAGSAQREDLIPTANTVAVTLDADYRKKGLIWYPTYNVAFDGAYTLTNPSDAPMDVLVEFRFPENAETFDNFSVSLDGQVLSMPVDVKTGVSTTVQLAAGATRDFAITYACRGMTEWVYRPGPHTGRVRNLGVTVKSNFEKVDFREGSLAPSTITAQKDGATLQWNASDLITQDVISVVVPERLNPGPLTSRITYFAPVCLIFFFVLIGTTTLMRKIEVHPMHYLFVAAGFFAFHLLLVYMVGLLNVHVSFVISAIVSVGLVTTYLSAALGPRFPSKLAAAGQGLFLVMFSYSFFIKGSTGLTVAIGSVVTLGVLMRVTAGVNWGEVFARPRRSPPITPPPIVAARVDA
jgi:hypothetical protein